MCSLYSLCSVQCLLCLKCVQCGAACTVWCSVRSVVQCDVCTVGLSLWSVYCVCNVNCVYSVCSV